MSVKRKRPQRSAADRTLTLPTFEPRISRERAFELVRRVPIGSTMRTSMRTCGNPDCQCAAGACHGPYWQADVCYRGRWRPRYVGSDEAKRTLEVAWRMVGAELAAAQAKLDATPEGRALAKLRAMSAFVPPPERPRKVPEPAPATKEPAAAE